VVSLEIVVDITSSTVDVRIYARLETRTKESGMQASEYICKCKRVMKVNSNSIESFP